ncbi:MAG: YbaB/EbfC family nucleoid-associated protein [Patescibacteria group bacterium]
MLDKMKKLFELQSKIKQIKQELATSTIETEAVGGKIKVIMNGEQVIRDIKINDSLIVSPDKEQFRKDLMGCINEAVKKSQKMSAEKAKDITGLDLPNL